MKKDAPKRQCKHGHRVEVVCCDLSKVYGNQKYQNMFQVRCAVDANTCQFSDYFFKRHDAIKAWDNSDELL